VVPPVVGPLFRSSALVPPLQAAPAIAMKELAAILMNFVFMALGLEQIRQCPTEQWAREQESAGRKAVLEIQAERSLQSDSQLGVQGTPYRSYAIFCHWPLNAERSIASSTF
jgi:hypothetical protein